jgi:hypothetical protein
MDFCHGKSIIDDNIHVVVSYLDRLMRRSGGRQNTRRMANGSGDSQGQD